MHKKVKITLIFIVVIVASSCKVRIVDYTIISTKNVDLSRVGEMKRKSTRVRGIDKQHHILVVPVGNANVEEAIDKALESTPGAVALVDGVVYRRHFYIPLIYNQIAYIIEGTPLVDGAIEIPEKNASTQIPYKHD